MLWHQPSPQTGGLPCWGNDGFPCLAMLKACLFIRCLTALFCHGIKCIIHLYITSPGGGDGGEFCWLWFLLPRLLVSRRLIILDLVSGRNGQRQEDKCTEVWVCMEYSRRAVLYSIGMLLADNIEPNTRPLISPVTDKRVGHSNEPEGFVQNSDNHKYTHAHKICKRSHTVAYMNDENYYYQIS